MDKILESKKAELDHMIAELKLAEEQLKPLKKRVSDLNEEIKKYKLNNGLYYPMSELENYKGKRIRTITLVERDEDGTLDTDFIYFIYDDDFFEVTNDGHLYYSSYNGGITEYDSDAQKYVHMYYGHPEYHNYVGFTEIDVRD